VAVVEEGTAEEESSELNALVVVPISSDVPDVAIEVVLSGSRTIVLGGSQVVSVLAVNVGTAVFAYKLSLTGPQHHPLGAPSAEQCQSVEGEETAGHDLPQSMLHSFSAAPAWPPSLLPQ
jgi:hypothetical protein